MDVCCSRQCLCGLFSMCKMPVVLQGGGGTRTVCLGPHHGSRVSVASGRSRGVMLAL